MLKIQEFIHCFDTMQEASVYLARNLKIVVKPFKVDNAFTAYMFNPALKADMDNPLVRETNCLILDKDAELLAKAWDHPLVAESADESPDGFKFDGHDYFMEIPDGKIVVVYNIDGKWFLAVQEDPEANLYITEPPVASLTYEHEIKSMWAKRFGTWDSPFQNTNPMMSYTFMYVDQRDDTIMPCLYKEMYLMGVVDLETGKEFSTAFVEAIAKKCKFALPNHGVISNRSPLASCLGTMRALCPGLIIRNEFNNRLVVNNPIYTTVKNAKDAGTRIRPTHIAKILNACRDKGDMVAVATAYENFDEMLRLLWSVRIELWQELTMLWNAGHGGSLKEFAGIIQHHPLNFLLFMLKNGEIYSLKEALDKLKPGKLVSCAKNKWEREFEQASAQLKYFGGTNGVIEEETNSSCIPWAQEGD